MNTPPALEPVRSEPGRPLYQSVKEAVRTAVDTGRFSPGERLPSTKALSGQLGVSLVTVHRALQELVNGGVLRRGQGHGTFVHEDYLDRAATTKGLRFGLVFQAECSLADSYHGQVLEGVRRGAAEAGADLVILQFGEDWRNECHGFIYVNPFEEQLDRPPRFAGRKPGAEPSSKSPPTVVVGASWSRPNIWMVDTDNHDIARQAVHHLFELGHRRIGCITGGERVSNTLDRMQGYHAAMAELGLPVTSSSIVRAGDWRLAEHEQQVLLDLLRSPDRPTGVFAGGFSLALGVYQAAQRAGLRVPEDLSIVGLDDARTAVHLQPPLTALRQPLIEMGALASRSLLDLLSEESRTARRTLLKPSLIVRGSSSPPGCACDAHPPGSPSVIEIEPK